MGIELFGWRRTFGTVGVFGPDDAMSARTGQPMRRNREKMRWSAAVEARFIAEPANGQHYRDALAVPSRWVTVWEQATDHDESMDAADLHGSRGRISTTNMRPCLHCGHWCNESPVSSS